MTDARGELLALADYLDAGHNYLSDPEMIAKYKRWSAALRAAPVPQCEAEPGAYLADGTKIKPRQLHPFYDDAPPSRSDAERQRLDYDAQTGRRLESAKAHQRFDAGSTRPICQNCKRSLAVASITGTHGLCDQCVKGGFPLVPPPSEAGREAIALVGNEKLRNEIQRYIWDGAVRNISPYDTATSILLHIIAALSPDPGTVLNQGTSEAPIQRSGHRSAENDAP